MFVFGRLKQIVCARFDVQNAPIIFFKDSSCYGIN